MQLRNGKTLGDIVGDIEHSKEKHACMLFLLEIVHKIDELIKKFRACSDLPMPKYVMLNCKIKTLMDIYDFVEKYDITKYPVFDKFMIIVHKKSKEFHRDITNFIQPNNVVYSGMSKTDIEYAKNALTRLKKYF